MVAGRGLKAPCFDACSGRRQVAALRPASGTGVEVPVPGDPVEPPHLTPLVLGFRYCSHAVAVSLSA